MFNGSTMAVERAAENETTICCNTQKCCDNETAARRYGRWAQLHVVFHATMRASERRAMRGFVYRNAGFDSEQEPDTVTFVSASRASSRRRLVAEGQLVGHLRAYVAARHPDLRFVLHVPEQVSFADELQLLRRTRVYVSLFSSALHLCRLLPPGSIVVELHGALLVDWQDAGYAQLCAASMGLRWVGVAALNAVPALSNPLLAVDKAKLALSPDFARARVDANRLVASVDAALAGDWPGAIRQYPLPVFGLVSVERDGPSYRRNRTSSDPASALRRGTVKALLKLPQYSSAPWWSRRGGWRGEGCC